MSNRISRMLKSMLLVLMSAIILAGGGYVLPETGMAAYAAGTAQKAAKSVSKQKQLKKALKGKKNRKNKAVTITRGGKYTIYSGSYKNVTVTVRKKVRLKVYGKGLRIILEKGAEGSTVYLYRKNTVESRCNATVKLGKRSRKSTILATGNGNVVTVINNSRKKKLTIKAMNGQKRTVKKGKKNKIYIIAPTVREASDNTGAASADSKQGDSQNPADSKHGDSQNPADSKQGGSQNPAAEAQPLVDSTKTRLIDLGFAKYVAVTFAEGRNLSNTKILVDGADVSGVMTPVSDDGSVVKWEVSTLKPAQLVAQDRSNASVKTAVKLSDNAAPQTPEVRASEAPAYVLGYAAVAYWDYYLTNYDENGKARVHASKTTFSRAGQEKPKAEHPYYAPDAEVDENGSGIITIMFNYNTDAEKAWFDAIPEEGALELVSHDQYRNVWNDHLEYVKKSAVPHGDTYAGIFEIPFGQDNFRTNGRYYVRIKPASGNALLADVNVVNKVAPVLTLDEYTAIQPGQNVKFHVENMVYGIQDPIEQVTLTGPDGKTEALANIDDYFLMSQDLFTLYNDVSRDGGKGKNHTSLPGQYTITIQAAGFKTASCTFTVSGDSYAASASPAKLATGSKAGSAALEVEEADKTASAEDEVLIEETAALDAVSMATGFSGGSGSGSGSGTGSAGAISADLVFNVDLLVNAEIFDKLGLANSYATAIVDRYETQMTHITAVYDKTGTKYFDFSDYYNAVQNAAQGGTYLTFARYSESGRETSKSSRVKEVLEDNLLGDLQEDGYTGLEAPKLVLVDADGNETASVMEGTDAYLTTADPAAAQDYLGKVTGLYNEISWYAPIDNTDNKSWSVADGKLRISSSLLKLADTYNSDPNAFTIKAEGYKDAVVNIPYEKALENITLTVLTPEEDRIAGNDITVSLEGSSGDFAKHLTAVLLQDGEEEGRRLLSKSEGGESGNDWYELNEDASGNRTVLVLKGGLFKHAAQFTLTMQAGYYEDLTVSFDVAAKPQEEGGKKTPKAVSAKEQSELLGSSYKLITFTMAPEDAELAPDETFNEDEQVAKWLEAVEDYGVTVNGTEYRSSSYNDPDNWFEAAGDPVYGGPRCLLKLGLGSFKKDGNTEITIKAEGYLPYTFTVKADGTIAADGAGGDDHTDKAKPAPVKVVLNSRNASNSGYFELTGDEEFNEWLKHVTGVKVNDTELSYDESGYITYASGYGITDSFRQGETSLYLTRKNAITDGKNQITIKAEGYEDLRLVLTQTPAEGGGWWASPTYELALAEESSETASISTQNAAAAADIPEDENFAGDLFSGEETGADEAAQILAEEETPSETETDDGMIVEEE